jgi:hypothetical protein
MINQAARLKLKHTNLTINELQANKNITVETIDPENNPRLYQIKVGNLKEDIFYAADSDYLKLANGHFLQVKGFPEYSSNELYGGCFVTAASSINKRKMNMCSIDLNEGDNLITISVGNDKTVTILNNELITKNDLCKN